MSKVHSPEECPREKVRGNVKEIGEGPGKVQGDRRMTRVYVLEIMSKGVYPGEYHRR